MLAAEVVQPPFSLTVLLTLVAIFGASLAVFLMEVRRWTTRRQWLSLAEWARERRMRLAPAREGEPVPPPLEQISHLSPQVRLRVRDRDGRTNIVQFQTAAATSDGSPPDLEAAGAPRWNVLIRRSSTMRPAAGLRPVRASGSVIELFRLTPFHSLTNDRFAVLAEDGKTASQLARSSARALLPPDVGLLQTGEYVLLDFSTRPFDPVELDRLLAVADQICQHC